MPEPILEVRDLTVHFYTYAGIVKAIERVSFDVYRGETFALVGETGCGKSVTSRALTQLIESPGRIVEGQVLYHREDGSVVVEEVVCNREAFRSFVLTFLEGAEILGPPELRDDLIGWLEGMA
jgi:ABC-type dipeptide/oligopeptide/nickel transport system ATPase component